MPSGFLNDTTKGDNNMSWPFEANIDLMSD